MLPFEFKSKGEVILFISIPFTSKEVKITSEKEVDHCQESNGDEEEFRMVVNKVASALGVEAALLMSAGSQELSGAMDPRQLRKVNGNKFPMCCGIRRQ